MKIKRLEMAYKLGATFKYQQDVIACMDRFRTIKKPRQAGMTTAFAIEALIDALTYDKYVIAIISPTKRQSDRMMRYIKGSFRKLEKELGYLIPTEKFTSEEIYFHHGSEIHSLPNNPLGVQGYDCNHAIVDEAGLFAQHEGEQIIDALVGSLAAKQGRLTLSGRPNGKRGLLWQYWDEHSPKYKEFTHFGITWEDRAREDPKYGEEVLKHQKILSKLQFDEIYNAMFVEEGILVFPHVLLKGAIDLWDAKRYVIMPPEGRCGDDKPRFIGIDFGRKKSRTEIHTLQQEFDGTLRTLMMKTLEFTNFEDQKIYIDDLIVRTKPRRVEVDERGMGLPILDYLVKKHGSTVQPLKMTNLQTKEKIILQCRNIFTDLKIAIPDDPDLYEQLHWFQREYTDQGNVRYFGKVDETDFQDDKVIALSAAVDAANTVPFTFSVV